MILVDFTNIMQDYVTGSGEIMRMSKWNNPECAG